MSIQQADIPGNVHNSSSDESLVPLLQITRMPSRNRNSSTNSKGVKWYEATFLVVNATLGAGLLNFPQAYDLAGGIFVASFLLLFFLVFVIGALLILAHCSDINRSSTYQDVVLGLCGKRSQQICSIIIVIYLFGACITFLVVIGDQFDRVLASLYGSDFCHFWYMDRPFTLSLTAIVLILPLCFPRRIDFLKYPSALGMVSSIYLVFLVVYQYYNTGYHKETVIKTVPSEWTDCFLVVPAICFGFQCHISSVPVYSCLKNRNVKTFTGVILTAMGFCATAYSLVAIFGYLTFGTDVPSDVLLMYDASNVIVLIGIIMLAIKTITAYPVLIFCARMAIDNLWMSWTNSSVDSRSESKRRIVTSSLWFFTTLVLAVVTPNIGIAIRALGSLAALMIFVFPGLILFQYTLQKDPHLYLLKDRITLLISIFYQALGAFMFGVVMTQSFTEHEPADKIRLCSA